MNRTTAREIAIGLCFACSNSNQTAGQLLEEFFAGEHYETLRSEDELFSQKPDEKQLEYIKKLVTAVEENGVRIDDYIEKYSKGWKLSRISKTALAVLRCAIAEILFIDDVPASAAINEAVELDKGYDEPETVAFVNGILGGFMKGEFPETSEKTKDTVES